MSLNIDDRGNIYIYKGDSGEIVVSGLPTDKNYKVYFSIKDLKNRTINSLDVMSNFNDSVTFSITSEFSDMLLVPKDEEVGFYSYGIKTIDDNGVENTLFVDGSCYGETNRVLVFPEKVEVQDE